MIRVEVDGYCHQCMDFTPDITPPTKMPVWIGESDETITQTDTIIKCKHCKRCANIRRYLEQQMKEEASG